MAKVGALNTGDQKPETPKPDDPKPEPKPEPDGNTPVSRQETQAERDARRPIDQA